MYLLFIGREAQIPVTALAEAILFGYNDIIAKIAFILEADAELYQCTDICVPRPPRSL